MALSSGDRVGAYEIVGLLGHGAMGEVYRARDTRLGREVAVKVLPAGFANDSDRLSRLEREARLISRVHHPNICTLFDIFEGQDAPVLILELIEGETLQQRLLRGPMTLREALRCASGIASALEAAHAKGIIHRDLKPSNIKITAGGTTKVLDFGVAKLAHDSGSASNAPDLTLTIGGTKEGMLVGTVAYVSPEQAMGDRVDGRSDIWAFGCLLYEMLTARRAFPSVAVADTLGAVMRGEPDWTALPADTPPALRTLLRRCLEKDRLRRLADIADARLEIEDLLSGRSEPASNFVQPAGTTVTPARRRWARASVALSFVAGVIFATAVARLALTPQTPQTPMTPPAADISPPLPAPAPESRRDPPPAQPNVETPVPRPLIPPDGVRWAPAVAGGVPNTIVALSPDGRLVVFSGRAGNQTALWLRSLASNEVWRLPGTDAGISPFWSPDSSSIGFFADRQLKRLDLNGLGTRARDPREIVAPLTLCEVRTQRGGTWGPGDTIVFSPYSGGLRRISASGGAVATLTYPTPGEAAHLRPQFLAGTRHLLYRVTSGNGRNNRYYATSLDSSERKLIATLDSGNVTYSQGHLLFMQNNILIAQPFDVNALAVTGAGKPVASGVLLSTGSPPVFGVFSASQNGTLVYLSQGGDYNDPMTVLADWARHTRP
jgi:serine/threonine protein kinase